MMKVFWFLEGIGFGGLLSVICILAMGPMSNELSRYVHSMTLGALGLCTLSLVALSVIKRTSRWARYTHIGDDL